MNFTNSKFAIAVFVVLCVLSLSFCVYRDIEVRKHYPLDLRNRVVGSRLQMDGISPYFYHWKESDGLRYYDWGNGTSNLKISNITATPFFHQLISPIANYSYDTITKIWLICNYLAFLIIVIIALRLCTNSHQRVAVIVACISFLYTHAWINNTYKGQLYLMIALLSMCFCFMLSLRPKIIYAMFAGLFAMSLVLIRPNAIIFLLPFLLLAPNYTRKYKLALVAPALFLMLIAFSTSSSRQYWTDYRLAVKDHIKVHQKLTATTQDTVFVPIFNQFEGWDIKKINEAKKFPFYKYNEANGNVFVYLNKGLNVRTPLWLLGTMCLVTMAALTILFFKRHGAGPNLNLYTIATFSFLLYMLTDMFSPVHRFHYNASQWIFPLLLTASTWTSRVSKVYVIGVFSGLILNSLSFSMFRMQHSIGEYIMCLSLIALLLTYKTDPEK
ncbi:glycosyltransferase 87 family protein [Flavitalea sp.]|nr:glycosyltransferase 87 family protein [Flavitalea sp.]